MLAGKLKNIPLTTISFAEQEVLPLFEKISALYQTEHDKGQALLRAESWVRKLFKLYLGRPIQAMLHPIRKGRIDHHIINMRHNIDIAKNIAQTRSDSINSAVDTTFNTLQNPNQKAALNGFIGEILDRPEDFIHGSITIPNTVPNPWRRRLNRSLKLRWSDQNRVFFLEAIKNSPRFEAHRSVDRQQEAFTQIENGIETVNLQNVQMTTAISTCGYQNILQSYRNEALPEKAPTDIELAKLLKSALSKSGTSTSAVFGEIGAIIPNFNSNSLSPEKVITHILNYLSTGGGAITHDSISNAPITVSTKGSRTRRRRGTTNESPTNESFGIKSYIRKYLLEKSGSDSQIYQEKPEVIDEVEGLGNDIFSVFESANTFEGHALNIDGVIGAAPTHDHNGTTYNDILQSSSFFLSQFSTLSTGIDEQFSNLLKNAKTRPQVTRLQHGWNQLKTVKEAIESISTQWEEVRKTHLELNHGMTDSDLEDRQLAINAEITALTAALGGTANEEVIKDRLEEHAKLSQLRSQLTYGTGNLAPTTPVYTSILGQLSIQHLFGDINTQNSSLRLGQAPDAETNIRTNTFSQSSEAQSKSLKKSVTRASQIQDQNLNYLVEGQRLSEANIIMSDSSDFEDFHPFSNLTPLAANGELFSIDPATFPGYQLEIRKHNGNTLILCQNPGAPNIGYLIEYQGSYNGKNTNVLVHSLNPAGTPHPSNENIRVNYQNTQQGVLLNFNPA